MLIYVICSNTIEHDYADLIKIVNILQGANMKGSLKKINLFNLETIHNIIKTNPVKIATITKKFVSTKY